MQRPTPGDHLPSPVGPGQQTPSGGYGPSAHAQYQPFAAGGPAFSLAPNPFAVANPTAPPLPTGRVLPRISELVHAFKRRWVLSLLIGGLVAAVASSLIWMIMPSGKHEGQAKIQILSRAESAGVLGIDKGVDEQLFDKFVEAELERMRTKEFLDQVASDPAVAALPIFQNAPSRSRAVQALLTLKRDKPEIVTVVMTGDEKESLEVLLKKYVETYVASARSKEAQARKDTLDKCDHEITQVNKVIEKNNKDYDTGGSSPLLIDNLLAAARGQQQTLSAEITKATEAQRAGRAALQGMQDEKKSGNPAPDPADVKAELDRNGAVKVAGAKVTAAEETLKSHKQKLQPGNPQLLTDQKDLDTARAEFDAVARDAIDAAVGPLRQARLQRLDQDIVKQTKANADVDARLGELGTQKTAVDGQLATLATQSENATKLKNLNEQLYIRRVKLEEFRATLLSPAAGSDKDSGSRFQVLAVPEVYENYNLKQKITMAVLAGVAGLLGILLVIAYLEWRNRRVDGVDQVVTELGMRVIGTIPAFPSRASLTSGEAGQNQNWRFILNESVNSTRTMLLHAARTQQMQVIMVTSAMQGEGKTSLSSQLATSMATAGLRTLILDADMRNPSMQKLFDIPVAPGCAEVLLQEIDVADAVQPTTVPNLWIIPAGQCNHRVIAALAQGHPLETLFNRLRGQFDIVVVDSCPILPVADTLLVAQHVDGVVFSILQDVSQLPKVQEASDRLAQLNIQLLGAVVNGIKPDTQAYGYNYVKQLPA